ncbi:MAG: tol-pal system protein YbgF, partial [Nitrospirota bacterium]
PDPNQMYHQAYNDYINGNYEIAVSEFREYLKDFPDAEFAGNAQFWIGESLYSMKKYDDALPEFEKVIKNYPDSSKVADALVKKGYTLDALNRPPEAKAAYAEVLKKFPDSDAAKLAAERLKRK